MKLLQLLFSALFLVQAVNAQDAVYTDTSAASSDTKTIRLKTYKLTGAPLNTVAAVEIFSVQWDTARLGFVQVGMANRRMEAVPALPYEQYLQEYVNRQYASELRSSGMHLLLAVKDVRINERTFMMNERGYCRVKADVYASKDGKDYAFVQAFDIVKVRNGMDVTTRHDENLAYALHELLQEAVTKGASALSDGTATQSKDAIKATQLAGLNIPILVDAVYTDGVYANFEEFKANKPSTTAFKAEKVKKKIRLFTDDADKKPIENVWGFCYKGELYRMIGEAIIPIEKSGHGFVVSNYLQSARRRNQAMFWSAMGGGLIGSSIAANAMKPYLVNTIPSITSQQPEATALDMETGELTL